MRYSITYINWQECIRVEVWDLSFEGLKKTKKDLVDQSGLAWVINDNNYEAFKRVGTINEKIAEIYWEEMP